MSEEIVSAFFSFQSNQLEETKNHLVCDEFLKLIDNYNESLNQLTLPDTVTHVYNPTIYARYTFEMYVRKFCNTKKKIMFFGMNPGPWGMSQTGVPFGEISSVRDWLGIEGPVEKPAKENQVRPITGFDCTRIEVVKLRSAPYLITAVELLKLVQRESMRHLVCAWGRHISVYISLTNFVYQQVSGKRFWGLFKKLCGSPDNFFETSFVYNYINQQWMNSKGCNITPADFKMSQMEPIYNIGDLVFANVLKLYEVEKVVAIGRFCLIRAQKAISQYISQQNVQVVYLPHPSPRVVNNNNWEQKAISCLKNNNLLQYYCIADCTPE